MTAQVVKLRPSKSIGSLRCEECGAPGKAGCNCGARYIPANEYAAKAVAANPEKSDRAIAADIGVSDFTVRKARQSGASNHAPDKRIGKDGKKQPAKKTKKPPDVRQQVNKQCKRLTDFTHDYEMDFRAWLETQPALTDDAKRALVNILVVCSEQIGNLSKLEELK
jgi:hypothetical protein